MDELHLAGGEPLLIDFHYRILERLIKNGHTATKLYYDTNLSTLTHKKWDVIKLWKKFENIKLSLSLDGVDAQGEYIRHGLKYDHWKKNVNSVKSETPHVQRVMHFVIAYSD